jgi:hypothetical protein
MVVDPPPQHRSVGRHRPEKERLEYVHPILEVNQRQQFNEDMFAFSKISSPAPIGLLTLWYYADKKITVIIKRLYF